MKTIKGGLSKAPPYGAEWDFLQPCDPQGRITTAKWGMFCNDPLHPLNTICVKNLPADFCPSVRPPNDLPPGYAHGFLFRDSESTAGPQQPDAMSLQGKGTHLGLRDKGIHGGKLLYFPEGYNTASAIPGVGKLKGGTSSPPDRRLVNLVPDDGDPCCNRLSCADHIGKPWCISPMALYRYEASHPTFQLPLKADASKGGSVWLNKYFPAKASTPATMLAHSEELPLPHSLGYSYGMPDSIHHM